MKKRVLFTALFFILATCDRQLVEPVSDNPLDPENTETGGDPFNLTLGTVIEGILLDWQPLITLEPEKYLVYRKDAPNSAFVLAGEVNHPGSTYTDILDGESLTVNETYWYYVLAEKDNQVTDTSFIQQYEISLYLSTNLFLTKDTQGIKLTWSLDSDHQPDSYNIYRKEIDESVFQLINTVSYPDIEYIDIIDGTEFTVNNSYIYYVTSNINSIEVDISTEETISLSMDTNLSLTQEANSIRLAWSLESDHHPHSYSIYRKEINESVFQLINTVNYPGIEYTDIIDGTELAVNNSYVYYVTSNINSIEIDTSIEETLTLDFEITNITLSPRREDEILGVKIDWNPDTLHTPDSYMIYRSSSESGEYEMKSDQSNLSYFDSVDELEMGSTFYYYILAVFNNSSTRLDLAELKSVSIELSIPGSYENIQSGIENSIDGDSINVASGTYLEYVDYYGKKITLKCQGNPGDCILDGNGSGPVVSFTREEDSTTVLDGFTIKNGVSTQDGGGMILDAHPLIKNCIFEYNIADKGGAIMIDENAKPILRNCQFIENLSVENGGAIFCDKYSEPVIENCIFTENISSAENGGALSLYRSTASITSCVFLNNHSDEGFGGSIFSDESDDMTLYNCSFNSNEAIEGGALYILGSNDNTISNCSFNSNKALDGGALYIFESNASNLYNCNFNLNESTQYGGAAFINDSRDAEFRNCLFSKNTSEKGGAIFIFESVHPSLPINIKNCIFWNQSAYNGGALYTKDSKINIDYCTVVSNSAEGSLTDPSIGGGFYFDIGSEVTVLNSIFHANISEDDAPQMYLYPTNHISINFSDIEGGWDPSGGVNWDGGNNIDADPLFENSASGDFQLQIGSPCIGTGEGGTDMGAYGGMYGDWER